MAKRGIFRIPPVELGRIPRAVLAAGIVAPLLAAPGVARAAAPVVDAFTASPPSVAPGGTVSLVLDAHDPDCTGTCTSGCGLYIRADLTSWSASGGTFTAIDPGVSASPYTTTATWQAPAVEGSYTITVDIADSGTFLCGGRQTATATLQIQVTTGGNQPPVFDALVADPQAVLPGGTSVITATVSDPDGDPVTLTWTADAGTITPTGSFTAELSAPATPGIVTVTCTADDGNGGIATATVGVAVTDAVPEKFISAGLVAPHRVAAGPGGLVYVADDGLEGVAVVGLASGEVVTFLPLGPVHDLEVDWDGNLVLATPSGARVVNRLGRPVRDLDPGDGSVSPLAVAVDRTGRRYAVLYGDRGRVVVFDEAGKALFGFGGYGSGPGELLGARDVEGLPGGGFAVADTVAGVVRRYDGTGTYLGSFGGLGGGPGEFGQLEGAVASAGGLVFAADAFQDRVQSFTLDGQLRDILGTYGDELGELKTPTDAAVAEDVGRLVVASANTGRLEVFRLSDTQLAAPAAAVNPTAVAFGSVAVGAVGGPREVTLTNAGSAPLALFGVEATGDFRVSGTCPWELAPGESCTVAVTFVPAVPGAREGTLAFRTDAPGTPQTVALEGYGAAVGAGQPLALPEALDFGPQEVGVESAPLVVNLRNVGAGPLAVSEVATAAPFRVVGSTCGGTVPAGGVCSVSVSFRPEGTGRWAGSLRIALAAPAGSVSVALAGRGVIAGPSLDLSASVVVFGAVPVGGRSLERVLTVSNVGGAAVNLGAVTFSGREPADFDVAADGCTGRTLDPGGSCELRIVFAPTAEGTRTAVLEVRSDAPSSPDVAYVEGTGVTATGIPVQGPAGRALLVLLIAAAGVAVLSRRGV